MEMCKVGARKHLASLSSHSAENRSTDCSRGGANKWGMSFLLVDVQR